MKARGDTQINAINDAIRTNQADKPTEPLKDKYDVDQVSFNTDPYLRSQISQSGQIAAKDDRYVEYSIKNKGEPKALSIFQISRDRGVIVNDHSFTSNETLGDDRMYFSDQLYAAWAEQRAAANLNMMAQRSVVNKDTRKIFGTGNARSTLRPGDAKFSQVMGSDNGRPFARFLAHHHQALGDKRVLRIEVFGESKLNIFFVIG